MPIERRRKNALRRKEKNSSQIIRSPADVTYIHTYFICHKVSIVEYKHYVNSNGRLPGKLVLIVLAANYYIYNKYCSHTDTHTYSHTTRKWNRGRRKKRQTDRATWSIDEHHCEHKIALVGRSVWTDVRYEGKGKDVIILVECSL